MISAKIIKDSISEAGKRITTFQLLYPRFIHSELMTHRQFSRNASSSRAIPVKKMIEMVRNDPALPIHWGKNQPGMQANEQLLGHELDEAIILWNEAASNAADVAEKMMELGLHKQVANRILEPFQHISVVLTSTELDNWFELRAHPDAQPEIHELAIQMQIALSSSEPALLKAGEWHLPYISVEELTMFDLPTLQKISTARCCRVSYLKHDGTTPNTDEDIRLFDRLAGAVPLHSSPLEHIATPDEVVPGSELNPWKNPELHGNFKGWIQFRKIWEKEIYSQVNR